MNKRIGDYKQGEKDRATIASYLNTLLPDHTQFQPYYRTFQSTTGKDLNYLHYLLVGVSAKIPFIWLFKRTGIYLKVPPIYLDNPQRYLDWLIRQNYHLLICDDHGDKMHFTKAIPFTTVNDWSWYMSETDGNTNRMEFKTSAITMNYHHPAQEPKTLFGGSCLIEQLVHLISYA